MKEPPPKSKGRDYRYCRYCKNTDNNFRLYVRTRTSQNNNNDNNISKKGNRCFKAIGWYCTKCKIIETDDMIERSKNKFLIENAALILKLRGGK